MRKSLFPKAGNAGDRDRTGTKCYLRRILSPVRLPVPPLRREGDTQIRTGGEGFAVLCLTTWLCRRVRRLLRYNDIYYSRAFGIRQSFFRDFHVLFEKNVTYNRPLSHKNVHSGCHRKKPPLHLHALQQQTGPCCNGMQHRPVCRYLLM